MDDVSPGLSFASSAALHDRLRSEARRLAAPPEWLVASLIDDHFIADAPQIPPAWRAEPRRHLAFLNLPARSAAG